MKTTKTGAIAHGNIRTRKAQTVGPFSIFLDSGRRDEDGELIMEEFVNGVGEPDERPEREATPFLVDVHFYKNYLNPSNEAKLAVINSDKTMSSLRRAAMQCEMYVFSWDLNDEGTPIPIKADAIIEADVDADILWSIIGRFNEVNRPPLRLRKSLRSSSSQTASMEDTTTNTE